MLFLVGVGYCRLIVSFVSHHSSHKFTKTSFHYAKNSGNFGFWFGPTGILDRWDWNLLFHFDKPVCIQAGLYLYTLQYIHFWIRGSLQKSAVWGECRCKVENCNCWHCLLCLFLSIFETNVSRWTANPGKNMLNLSPEAKKRGILTSREYQGTQRNPS